MSAELQSLPVGGYQPQSQETVDLVNRNKLAEERVLRRMDADKINGDVDQRWLAIARTQMEQAWMAYNRAIFKPVRVSLPEDKEPD